MPESIDALALHRRALAEGVSIAPGPLFSPRRKFENYVRLNYGHFDGKSTVDALRKLGRLSADLMR
jgi:DNA-binding transcriptional MocR family regulator